MRVYTDLSQTYPDLHLELRQMQRNAAGNLDICNVNKLDPSDFMTANKGE